VRLRGAGRRLPRGARDPCLFPAAQLPLQLSRPPELQGQIRDLLGAAVPGLPKRARPPPPCHRSEPHQRTEGLMPVEPDAPRARHLIGYALAVFGLVWVLHDVYFGTVFASMRHIRWVWVAPAILFDVMSYVCQGVRWRYLLRPVGPVSAARATQAIYAGLFTNEVTPLRAGEFVRAYL